MKIEIKSVTKSYGKKQVLKGIDLIAEGGKCIGILGGNGCGKSTLFSILAGIQTAGSGEFFYDGVDLFKNPAERAALVGYVPQGTPLFEELSAKDNLSLWYSKQEMEAELAGGVLKMLDIDTFLGTTVSKMSGGMKKRLSIGCAVAKSPPLLIMDEPMAALDIACKQKISEYIRRHKEKGGCVLIASHDVMEITLCDAWYVMKDGVLHSFEYTGTTEDIVKSL